MTSRLLINKLLKIVKHAVSCRLSSLFFDFYCFKSHHYFSFSFATYDFQILFFLNQTDRFNRIFTGK